MKENSQTWPMSAISDSRGACFIPQATNLWVCMRGVSPRGPGLNCFFLILSFLLPWNGNAQNDKILVKGYQAHSSRIIAKFKDHKKAQIAPALVATGLTVQRQIALVPGLVVLDEQPPGNVAGLVAPPQLPIDPKEKALLLARRIAQLQNSGQFDYVEPDYIVNIKAIPGDAAFSDGTLWGLRNTGQNGGMPGADIGAVNAWNITTGSSDVIVAVIDTGIRYTHQDLAPNMWHNPSEIPGNGIDDDGDGYVDNVFGINAVNDTGDPMDDNGHGTHVAGTIGAYANDANPHVGVAWKTRLMACKAGGADGSFKYSDVIKCIDFAVSKGARILNNSWGGGPPSSAVMDAITRARDRGVLFVAAAGNDGTNNDLVPHYPSSYPIENIIAVAALDRRDALALFSCYGRTNVHVGAPGQDIFSCWIGSDTDYKTISGTSMATPHVSGVAALVLSRYPDISLAQLRNQILGSVVPVAALQSKTTTGGRVNAYNALNASADGNLEVSVTPCAGSVLMAGAPVEVAVKVTDLIDLTNALVTGLIQGLTNLTFGNSGFASDATYRTVFTSPAFSNSLTLSLSISAPGKNSTNVLVPYDLVAPAPNNDFAKRTVLPMVTNLSVSGSNVRATKEAGEPFHAGNAGGKSIWWSWKAPSSGLAIISTGGSDFDTLLAVYTGSSISNLNCVVSSDDFEANYSVSQVFFNAVAGTTYQIAVDGYGGASGKTVLGLLLLPPQSPPANDSFGNRTGITGQPFALTGYNTGGTKETGEPNHAGNMGGSSVWYSWKAPSSGKVTLNTFGSDFDTLLGVYTGSVLSNLTVVASNDDDPSGGTASSLTFDAIANVTYQIAVDGYRGAFGDFKLALAPTSSPTGPANDNFSNATQMFGSSATVYGSNVNASKEANEPNHASNKGGKSVWWYWTASTNGLVTLSTYGSSFDTLLAVYAGSSGLTNIVSNDDFFSGSGYSKVTFYASKAATYWIAVDGYAGTLGQAATGDITLTLSTYTGQPPLNDAFTNRIILTGASITTNGTTTGATKEAGEPAHAGNSGGHSLWWSWRAPASGPVFISTEGSDFDTLLGVYTGSAVSALVTKASNNDDPNGGKCSFVSFNAVAGTVYQIAVDGYYGAFGNVALSINQLGSSTSIYWTQFAYADGYRVGYTLAGQNGWLKSGSGGNGILTNNFTGYGQQAYIGYAPPNTGDGSLILRKPVNYYPDGSTNNYVKFSVLLKIVDSSGLFGPWDHFRWSFYNMDGQRLFAVDFDNNVGRKVNFILDDASGYHDSGLQFVNGAIHKLEVYVAFSDNQWLATLDSVPLFSSPQPITTTGAALNLRDIDAVWALSTLNSPGDNYMVFDNYTIELISALYAPVIIVPPQSQSIPSGSNVLLSVTANGTAPFYYQWCYNGAGISGATNSLYSISNISGSQAGRYSVLISNVVGKVMSDEAVLLVTPFVARPANDDFRNAIPLSTIPIVTGGSSAEATKEPGEPIHAGNIGGKSIWWSWMSKTNEKVTVSTVGSDFDTLVGVYTGPTVGNLVAVANNDDAENQVRGSWLTFNATSNTLYHIGVDGFNGASGDVRLSVGPNGAPKIGKAKLVSKAGFQFTFSGDQGLGFAVQASTNLLNWATITNVFGRDGSFNVWDSAATNTGQRFYRILQDQ